MIDKRQNRVAPVLYGTDGGGWHGTLSELRGRYPWLSALAATADADGFFHDGLAVSTAANSPGPVTFVGSFPDAAGLSPSDLMVVLVFTGPDQQTYWATRITG